MKFIYGKNDFKTMERGQENCYLLTNGLGGFSSLTMIGSMARNDHALLMACTKAPNNRVHLLSRTEEILTINGKNSVLSSQEFVGYTRNETGFQALNSFSVNPFPQWIYQVDGVEIKKELAMKYGKNTLAMRFLIRNQTELPVTLTIIPKMQFVPKGCLLSKEQEFTLSDSAIESAGLTLFYHTNGMVEACPVSYEWDLYFSYDARDGRGAAGTAAWNHKILFQAEPGEDKECLLLYHMEEEENESMDLSHKVSCIFNEERVRLCQLEKQSGLMDPLALTLVKGADQFIVNRESVKGKTIIAGYPFFEDWGRDTMIALLGCCISTRRYEDAENIFRTFMKYCRKGLMPNIFPEGGTDPAYNTVDASLLFIGAVYEYYLASKNLEFIRDAYPVMKDILSWYQKGTDFHISMDKDGLLMAGHGLDQVTWMDVRIGSILPTPRHGKPVEINAYWYNAIKIMEYFSGLFHEEHASSQFRDLGELVKESFRKKFWNPGENCLKDVISPDGAHSHGDNQIRCNQIWAVSVPFGMLTREEEKLVVRKVFSQLYTPYGLRSLSPLDKEFCPVYGGSQLKRDLAYHQGTVWTFPLGGYYLAYLKVHDYSQQAISHVKEQLEALEACFREGCIGQVAEIYDGGAPSISHGCFAQAWSVGELLRVYQKIKELEK